MNFLILSVIIYGVAATPIGSTNKNPKILGGFDAYAGQFPYQALIRHSDYLERICGGSIISNQWILTSAACICVFQPTNKMRIVVGSIYLNSGGTTHTVLIALKHPDFSILPYYTNDIGLIRVNGQINYNDFVWPIQLSSDSSSVGLPLTISGWGYTSISTKALSNTLQYIIVKSISIEECKKLLPIPLFDTQLCTEVNSKQGMCEYDNGSPLVYNGQQHAVASMNFQCQTSPFNDVYTRVAPFRSWIKDITNI